MPYCSFCKTNFSSLKILSTHLKISHSYNENNTYNCKEINCSRSFATFKCFKQHFNKKHKHSDDAKPDIIAETVSTNSTKSNTDKVLIHKVTTSDSTVDSLSNVNIKMSFPDKNVNQSFIEQNFYDQFKKELESNMLSIICVLYEDSTFCRKDVQKILELCKKMFVEPFQIFNNYLKLFIEPQKINIFFDIFNDIFEQFKSEYLRFNVLKKSNLYIPPTPVCIGEQKEQIKEKIVTKMRTAQFISIGKVLQLYFEIPGMFDETIHYMKKLYNEKQYVCNVIQTDFWKNKTMNLGKDEIAIPLFLYYDDFECGNPLGSHAGIHKLGAVYYSVPCIPIQYRASLNNIFLCLLFHSADLKKFGSRVIFSKLIEELVSLENEGIIITVSNKTYKLKIFLTLILGDNLGLNTILGLNESFRSNFFCRFCKCSRKDCEKMWKQNDEKLRTEAQYSEDINKNSPSTTGLRELCVFNTIKSFHSVSNYSVDLAHDILEGIGEFDLVEILYKVVIDDKLFSLETLNSHITFFNFGSQNINKPPLITLDN